MKNTLILVVEIHLILSFSLVFTLIILGIKKLGFKKFFRDLKSDSDLWLVLLLFLTSPYQVVLIGVGQIGKKTAEIMDKIKKVVAKDE